MPPAASSTAMISGSASRLSQTRAIYTANGDVVNLGAKLEKKVKDISARGGILLSESTGRCVAGDFRLEQHEMDIEGEALISYAVTGSA